MSALLESAMRALLPGQFMIVSGTPAMGKAALLEKLTADKVFRDGSEGPTACETVQGGVGSVLGGVKSDDAVALKGGAGQWILTMFLDPGHVLLEDLAKLKDVSMKPLCAVLDAGAPEVQSGRRKQRVIIIHDETVGRYGDLHGPDRHIWQDADIVVLNGRIVKHRGGPVDPQPPRLPREPESGQDNISPATAA